MLAARPLPGELCGLHINLCALIYGAFAYFADHGAVLAVNCIGLGHDLAFGKPQAWLGGDMVTRELSRQQRLEEITIHALRNAGARFFAWINPGEAFDLGGFDWVPAAHGGFLYIFRDDPLQPESGGGEARGAGRKDIFFAVDDSTDVAEANSLLRQESDGRPPSAHTALAAQHFRAFAEGHHASGMRMYRTRMLYWAAALGMAGVAQRLLVENVRHVGGREAGTQAHTHAEVWREERKTRGG